MVSFELEDLAIALRSPDFTDTQDLVLGVQRRRDMAGRAHTWIPPENNTRLLTLTFRALAREKYLEFLDFITATAGTQVKYTDPNGAIWLGVITTQVPTVTAEGVCREVTTIQFEGEKQ